MSSQMWVEMVNEQTLVTRRAQSSRWAPVAAIGIPTLLVGLHALVYGRWIIDDAAITFAYVRSIANGLGPVLQPGAETVEGYSNPAWLALLLAVVAGCSAGYGGWLGGWRGLRLFTTAMEGDWMRVGVGAAERGRSCGDVVCWMSDGGKSES